MAAGLGFKTFTTGEVLTAADVNGYLMQGLLVFANAAARDAAITSPQEGQACYLKDTDAVLTYSGSAWVGFDDSNAIQNSIINAKGDLIAGSANDTPAILAVGNSGETLVADSAATTGLRWQAHTEAGKNFFINGGMDIWQRGTSSLAFQNAAYTADRWQATAQGGSTGVVSRQATGDTTNLPFIQFCARVQRNSGQTNLNNISFIQSLETVNSIPLAGKTVVLSFYARAGANFSASSSTLKVDLVSGTGTDQNWSAFAYTGSAYPISSTGTLTTTWQRFTFTGTVAATATEISTQIYYTPTGTAGANDYFEITGVQLELGSAASNFSRTGGTLQGELAACLYYFNRIADFSAGGSNGLQMIVTAQNFATTGGYGVLQYPKMRISPTATFSGNADFFATGAGGNNIATTAMAANQIKPNSAEIRYTTASGLVAGNAALLYTTTTTGKLDLSAEL